MEEVADYQLGRSINMVFLNNLYYGTQKNRPAGEKAILADPKFMELVMSVDHRGALSSKRFSDDPFIHNFCLQEDSLCVGKGLMISDNGSQDLLGKQLGHDICSIGAIE